MFERFTDRARRVVVLAQEVSRLFGHPYIDPLHVLAGLSREGEGIAYQALEKCGITYPLIEDRLDQEKGGPMPAGHIPFTAEAKRILELSLREALQLGHNYIGTEHVLLAIMKHEDNEAARLIADNVDHAVLRKEVIALLTDRAGTVKGAEEAGDGKIRRYRATLKQTTYKTFEIEATSLAMAHAAAYGAACGKGNIEPVEVETTEWQSSGFEQLFDAPK